MDGIAVVGDFPPVVGNEGRQQYVRILAYLVGLDDRVHHVLGVLAVVMHPVDVPVHDGVLVVRPDDGGGLQGAVGNHNHDGNAGVGRENKLLRRYQKSFGVGGEGAARPGLGGGYLRVHHAAFVFQFNDFGGQFTTLDHPGEFLAHFVRRADGEVAQYLHTGQLQRMGRRLVAGKGLAPGGCRGGHQRLLNCRAVAKCPDGCAGGWKSRAGGAPQ